MYQKTSSKFKNVCIGKKGFTVEILLAKFKIPKILGGLWEAAIELNNIEGFHIGNISMNEWL